MKVNKKKIIVLVSLVVLLAGVACLNYFLTVQKSKNAKNDTQPEQAAPTFFASETVASSAVVLAMISSR